eukprot:CAMPEP_0173418210 /NCGR_PEP_ID=MMETSP1357-20121228/428_1 /TAXON_ID=77926 /ORGANISM="Hemiselmis rufescens, Strain PCC563" /LENGTH=40 /DNA_ID= /DNA_START= /DNA_END= /DNA_ORIENTATION=
MSFMVGPEPLGMSLIDSICDFASSALTALWLAMPVLGCEE